MPYIPFKINTAVPKGNNIWSEMYHYFMTNRTEFLDHYHKRSNVETAFSMIKPNSGMLYAVRTNGVSFTRNK